MNITKFAIKNQVITLSLMVILIFAGVMIYQTMPRDDMPPFLVRVVSVVTLFPGASPERMELLVSDPIEKACQEVPEVDHITSENRTSVSVVMIYIKDNETHLQPIYDRLRRKVEDVEAKLPEGVASVEFKDEGLADVYGIMVGLTADGFSYAELKKVADDIRDDLIKLPNVAKVEISGAQEERVFIDYNNARLSELGLTQVQLQNIISATNIVFSGGDIKVDDERIILEPTGNYETVEDIRNTIISANNNELIRLGDVTNVYRGYVEPETLIAKVNGKPSLVIAVNLKKGGNIIQMGREVDEKIIYYRSIYPHGITIQRIASQDEVVEKSVLDFLSNLIQAVVVVLLVMLLFLGLRTGLVVASLIPTTMVITILFVALMGIGLNQVSLASLIIVLGMLVDNAIVVSESIMVKMEKGAKQIDAAVDSARELFIPLLTSSLTTAAAFLAFYLAESVMGEIMGELFIVVATALLVSWILSMTMIPLLCVYFLRVKKEKKKDSAAAIRFRRFYEGLLLFNLKRPYVLIGMLVGMFVLVLFLFRFIPFIFFPDSTRPLITATVDLPLGTSIERTDAVVTEIENYVTDHLMVDENRKEGVVSFASFIGGGAPKYDLGYTPPETLPSSSHILLNTSSDKANQQVVDEVDAFIFETFPEVNARVTRLKGGGGSADPISIRISGKYMKVLYGLAEDVKTRLADIKGAKSIRDDWGPRTKKFFINVDQTRAGLAGVTNQDIALSMQSALGGMQTGQFREENQVIPIVMRRDQTADQAVENLEGFDVHVQQTGKSLPLKQVADMDLAWEASKILRRDLTKTITVTAGVRTGYTAMDVMEHLLPWLQEQAEKWPFGYTYELGGENEDTEKNMGAVGNKLPISLFIIIFLLIAQFNSVRKPLIILLTIPLGFIGVVLGLLIGRSFFGFMAFLGVISLAGVVINNAIVLLDRIRIEMVEFSRTAQEAIIEASHQRFRPILLTTATTVVGLIPLWIGGGPIWQPMAISIMFGLLFATVLTLLLVPVLYRLLFRVSYKGYEPKV